MQRKQKEKGITYPFLFMKFMHTNTYTFLDP